MSKLKSFFIDQNRLFPLIFPSKVDPRMFRNSQFTLPIIANLLFSFFQTDEVVSYRAAKEQKKATKAKNAPPPPPPKTKVIAET